MFKCPYCGRMNKQAYKGACIQNGCEIPIGKIQTILNREEICVILDSIAFRLQNELSKNPDFTHDMNVIYNILLGSNKLIVEGS